ncbi:hypothetical protein ES705_49215 [subsurface metagenome]
MMVKYKLKDNQIAGRYYGVDVVFDSLEEVRDTLTEALENNSDDDEDFTKLPLREILEMMDYEIEEIK